MGPPTSHLPHPSTSSSFNHHSESQPTSGTHGHKSKLPSPPPQLIRQRSRYARTRRAERMADRNAATHNIEPGAIDLADRLTHAGARCPLVGIEAAKVREHLRSKRFVHLDQVHVLQR